MKPQCHFQVPTQVSGIPCLAAVTSYSYDAPYRGSAWTCDSDRDYYGGEDIEFLITDRKGYKAPWLERKASAQDKARITQEISQWVVRLNDDY